MNIMRTGVIVLVLEGDGWIDNSFRRFSGTCVLIPMMTLDRMKGSKFLLHYMLMKMKTGKRQMPICYLRLVSCYGCTSVIIIKTLMTIQ